MAEIKNSFLSSKMNKDLDDRLIPNSEYRDALNIEVGKSETNNIGVLQNIYGNKELKKTVNGVELPLETIPNLECIGIFMDNQNNKIYQFLTNYTDLSPSEIILCETLQVQPLDGWVMKITVYDNDDQSYNTLVEGTFLNFSTTNLILGVNLIEGLLFWTDNRNQPRKININNALNNPTYYTTETQISVAKYAPVEPISLIRKITTTATSDQVGFTVTVEDNTGITPGMTIISQTPTNSISGANYLTVESVDGDGHTITIYNNNLIDPQVTISNGTVLTFLGSTMTNKSDDPDWPGDPSYLEDKYFRFSYRFKFDDNEFSLMAPYTQIAYIPKQKGYFINGNEDDAYRSTVIKWMENYVNNIELLIPLPDTCANIRNSYKIVQIEILSKESDSAAVKVVDTIVYNTFESSPLKDTNIYNYPYQSQKPFRTLPSDQITRVYDLVPVRALAQETAGNRIIYGNFYTNYTAPQYLVYNTTVLPKSPYGTNFIEYPNHTLKQNRNYQVGFVLADKFGRESSVILSEVDINNITNNGVAFGGSTVYAPYQTEGQANFPDVKDWFGNALAVLVSQPITSDRNIPLGTPGLYAQPTSTNGFSILAGATINTPNILPNPTAYEYNFDLDTSVGIINTLPNVGNKMRGAFTDYVTITDVIDNGGDNWTIKTDKPINDLYLSIYPPLVDLPDTKFVYTINEIGWYSYKVVVKQQQQEYYNTYLPGMLAGYPLHQTSGSQVVYIPASTSLSTSRVCNIIDGNNTITVTAGTTSGLQVGDEVAGIAGANPTTISEITDLTHFKVLGIPVGTFVGVTLTFFRIGAPAHSETQNGINTTTFPVGEENKTSHIVLINDNINKIPRDLVEVGPDQKQYRSSVQVYGKVENTAMQLALLGDPPLLNNYDATSITYTIADQAPGFNPALIKVGNGIQCDDANLPIPVGGGEAPVASTYRWLANTVITSHVINNDGTATITFTPPNALLDAANFGGDGYVHFTITRAENTQYYPTRKPDVVSSIANANDFNFLQNDVNNVKGTAGINIYQLQTNPLIGRVSTTRLIGVTGDNMVPFLSVYETAPVISALALFWETTSTGYISDLNYDVLTGYDGPTGFSAFNFSWFENQDPNGSDPDEGTPNSPYLTSDFEILNSTGVPLSPDTTPTIFSAFNAEPTDLKDYFEIEAVSSTLFRLRLKPTSTDFVFEHFAAINTDITFIIKIIISGVSYTLPITGRMENNDPSFKQVWPAYNKHITQDAQPIVVVDAVNGAFTTTTIDQIGLFWEITGGNANNYFSINPINGQVSLNEPSVYDPINLNPLPFGIYDLNIRVWDAYRFDPIAPLLPINTTLGSLHADTTIRVTVGPKTVNNYLQYFSDDNICWEQTNELCDPVPGQGYAAVYIGEQDLTLDAGHINIGLPDLTTISPNPPATSAYQKYYNIAEENGAIFGDPDVNKRPKGLTQGALQCKISSSIIGGDVNIRTGRVWFVLFYRALVTDPWLPVLDSNGAQYPLPITPTWGSGIDPDPTEPDGIFSRVNYSFKVANRSTYFTISNPGEYCIVIKQKYTTSGPSEGCSINSGAAIEVRDANWNYLYVGENPPTGTITTSPPFGQEVPLYYETGVVPSVGFEYLVGLEKADGFNTPNGIPWTDQDPSRTLTFPPTGSPGLAELTTSAIQTAPWNILKTTTYNEQIVQGLETSYRTVDLLNCYNVGLNITVPTPGNTNDLKKGMYVSVTAGTGAFAANTYVTDIINANTFTVNIVPTTPLGGTGCTVQGTNQYFPAGTKVTGNINVSGTGELSFSNPNSRGETIPSGSIIQFKSSNPYIGTVYAATDNGLNVNQFYIDNTLTLPWKPPFANKFYTFQNKNRNYNQGVSGMPGMLPVTNKPFFSAKFNSNGAVIPLTGTNENTVKTAWNYNANLTYVNWQRNADQIIEVP